MQTIVLDCCTGNVYILQPMNNNRKNICIILAKLFPPLV